MILPLVRKTVKCEQGFTIIHDSLGGSLVALAGDPLPVLRLPGVVDLEAAVELLSARLQELDVARRVDCVAQLGVRPLGQVVFTTGFASSACERPTWSKKNT